VIGDFEAAGRNTYNVIIRLLLIVNTIVLLVRCIRQCLCGKILFEVIRVLRSTTTDKAAVYLSEGVQEP